LIRLTTEKRTRETERLLSSPVQLREMLNDDRAAQNEEVINKGSTRVLLVLQRAFVLGILW
jgi:hypothetical protein